MKNVVVKLILCDIIFLKYLAGVFFIMLYIKNNKFFYGEKDDVEVLKLYDLRSIQSYHRGVKIITVYDSFIRSFTLSAAKKVLVEAGFFEVCRGCLVSVQHITHINGDHLILEGVNEKIHVSRRKKRELLKLFRI